MDKKNFKSIVIALLSLSMMVSILFGFVPEGHAQSTEAWSEPINLSNSGSASDPLLVVDARAVMHVIWKDFFEGYKYVESADGVTWTAPSLVPFAFSPKDDSQPTFLAGKNGSIHVFWTDKTNALFYSQTQSATFGIPSSWSTKLQLADSVVKFNAVLDPQDALHLSYVRNTNADVNPAGVYYRRLDGAGWSPVENLYSSQYFRSLTSENAHVRIAVSGGSGEDSVYVVWDDRLQKRIFMRKSLDRGQSWEEAFEILGPDISSGSITPFNVSVSVTNEEVLLLWQVGQPGGRCTQYSQQSEDGGDHFGDPIRLSDEFVSCPEKIDFVEHIADFSIVLLTAQDDLALMAWNGSRWSKLQSQSELSAFSNPVTFDNIIFGCPNVNVHNESLYVVGCDRGINGDIWLRSRPLGSFEEWFPPPSAWSSPVILTDTTQKLSSLSSVADYENNMHVFWVQTPQLEIDDSEVTIQYVRWNGEQQSKPVGIIAGFDSVPIQLSVALDNQGRLLLLWVEGENGDIYFSWANADRANLASEWSEPLRIPTPSEINNSPSILVDSSGIIVVVYAVPLNENRGIYIVQSDDLGKNWSQPAQVFDAVTAKWDSANQPMISLSEDGKLHLLFSRHSLREDNRVDGLYYSQSSDGGNTWSRPELVSEKLVQWSRFVSFRNQILYRIWQEKNSLSNEIFHQISRDAGATWENPIKVSSVPGNSAKVALATGWNGDLYIAQIYAENENLIVQVLEWDGSRWDSLDGKQFNIKGDDYQYSIDTTITSQGILDVIVSVDYSDLRDGIENEVFSFGRSLELTGDGPSPVPLLIATPATLSNTNDALDVQSTPTVSSPLANLYDAPVSPYRNWIGLLLVGGVVVLVLFAVWPRKKRESN